MATSKKRRKVLAFSAIALVVLLALVLVAIFKKKDPVIKDQVVTVQTEKVACRSLPNIVVANGQIQPIVQVAISPEVSGEIIELPKKEGHLVKKGDLLVKINPNAYIAAVNQAKAAYELSQATKASATASLEKAEADYQRNLELFDSKLLSQSDFIGFKFARNIAKAQLDSAIDQVNMAKAAVDGAEEELAKTTILSPLTGTITRLNSHVGEGVLGNVQNVGTTIMTISDLNQMEARVDIGEMDVAEIAPGQKARLKVLAFKHRKFTGVVTNVANSSQDSSGSGQSQIKFQARILLNEKEAFRSGMSVSAEIETEYHTNVLTVPLASVTTRPMNLAMKTDLVKKDGTNTTTLTAPDTNSASGTNSTGTTSKSRVSSKLVDVVFVTDGDHVKAVPVITGICDDNYWEITDGLTNGEEIVSGGHSAIDRDLQDGSKIRVGPAAGEKPKD